MSKLCKEKVPTEQLLVYLKVSKDQHAACDHPEKKQCLAETHDIFLELLQWRMIHERRQGDFGPVV